MRRTRLGWLWVIVSACIFFSITLSQDESRKDRSGSVSSADEADLRALAQEFYAAYAKKDLDGFLRLWSAKSPELASRRPATQKLFADHEKIELKSLTVRKVTMDGEKAKLRVDVELNAIETKTGKPAAGLAQMQQSLDCVKEERKWKLWRELSAAEDFADTLLEAKTEAEQSQLLAGEKELLNRKLLRTLLNRGVQFQQQANYPEALAAYRLLQTVAERLGEPTWIGAAFNGLGNSYGSQGNFAESQTYHAKALQIAEQAGDEAKIAASLNNLGLLQSMQGNFDSALEYLQRSLAISEKLKNQTGMARTGLVISEVHRDRGAYGLALEVLQKSVPPAEASGDSYVLAYIPGILGSIHYQQGNYNLALENYRKSLALHRAGGDQYGVAMSEGNIGKVHLALGDYRAALESQRRAMAQFEALGIPSSVAQANDDLGSIHWAQGDLPSTLAYYQKALSQFEAIGEKYGAAGALSNLSETYRAAGRHTEALQAAERATIIAREIGSRETLWQARENAGRAYRSLNQLAQARQALEESITTIEAMRAEVAGGEQEQQRSFERKVSPYHAMVELLAAQNQTAAAFSFAERARARALLDVLQSGRVNVTKAMTAAEQERERGFNNHLVSLNTQISRENSRSQPDPARLNDLKTQLQKARLDYEAFQTALYAAHPELKTQRGEVEMLTLEQARDLLPDTKSALLEYVVTDERTYLFALTGNSAGTAVELKVYPLEIKRKELDDRAVRFRETLAKGSPGFRQPSRELYDLLLKPAAAQLQGKTSLVIVPDGALWELPFQALQPSPTRYLIEDCAIAYAPSLTALREMQKLKGRRDKPDGSPTLLAFGNPALGKQTVARAKSVLMDEKLDPLPEAERQVNVMKQIYGAAKSKIYIGAEAREERAKAEAGGYRILHLATHGILNDSSPMYSHVLLAQAEGGSGEDGLLEAWEIMKLDLKADLAVLSACETARGRIGAGEGIIGLSWALFVAGCPTSVVSQWKVDSASTTELMLEFHRQLKSQMANPAGSFSPARALREAALKLQRTNAYRHPFYWAGFVVAGKGF
jgi:CHAT domain-containing protein